MVTDTELATIVDGADEQHEEMVSFLQEMIRTPSVNPPGEYEAIHELVTERYDSFGWEYETVRTPDSLLRELELPVEYPRPNVLAYVTRGPGPTIALNAHLDTVPVDDPETWTDDPFSARVANGRVYGRGANDSKGRIASYTYAARILELSDMLPSEGTVVLAITVDEETGGHAGPRYLLESGALEPDYAIVEGNCDSIWRAAAGVRQYEITVTGASAHAGINPDAGKNAIVDASHVIRDLAEYDAELKQRESEIPGAGSPTCTTGTIEGGIKTNIVPARCSFTVDQRVPPDFSGEELERELLARVDACTPPCGSEITVDVSLRADPYNFAADEDHVRIVKRNAEAVFGRDVPAVGVRGFTDGRFFAAAGAKTLNFGPGDAESNPHGIDESVAVDDVRDASAAVAASLLDLSRG